MRPRPLLRMRLVKRHSSVGLGSLPGGCKGESAPHRRRLPYWFLFFLSSNRAFGRQTLRASILKRKCIFGASCSLSETAYGCMGLETCCMGRSQHVAMPVGADFVLHARARSYTPTSHTTACILKPAAKNGLVSMAMLTLRCRVHFQEEISICLAAGGHNGPSSHFSRPIQPTAC